MTNLRVHGIGSSVTLVGQINGVYYLICSENADELAKSIMYYVLRN